MSSSTLLAPCQCARWQAAQACTRTATQEDLLCDPCRRGCSACGFAPVGTPVDQIALTNAHMEQVAMTWGDGVTGLLPGGEL